MATIALGIVGGIAGSFFGATQLGFSVGVAVGGIIDAKNKPQSTGRLSDLKISASQYGAVIPQAWGAYRLPVNLIDFTLDANGNFLHESSTKKGSKLTGTTRTYTYTASFACLVCAGPVTRIKRIWAADRLIYNDDATPKTAYNIRVYLGTETQTPDALLSTYHGATATPAYRGLCYFVAQDLPLADWGNALPNPLSVEIERWGALVALIQDSFNRADGLLGTADSGQAWQSSGSSFVASNRGLPGAGNQCFIDAGVSDGTLQLTTFDRDVPNTDSSRIVARYVDTNNYWYFGESAFGGTYNLTKKVAGLFTAVASAAMVAADGDVLKLTMDGPNFTASVNGTVVLGATDSFQQTATKHGFGSASGSTTVDDFTLTPLTSTAIQVKDIMADVFAQEGLVSSQWDVTAATDTVDGDALTERQSGRDFLDSLLRVYKTLLAEYDGKIVAVKRGQAAVVTIPATDLGAALWTGTSQPTPPVEVKRLQELELPFRVDLTYLSKFRNYQLATQGAERYTKVGLQDPVTITTPLVLTDDAARQAAEQQLYQMWTEREQFTFSLPLAYLYLAPGDVVNLPVLGQTVRARLIQMDAALPGPIQCTAVLDDAGILVQTVLGAAVISAGEEATDAASTTLIAWNGNALVDADADSIGLYFVANGATAGYWPGAQLYWSTDSGVSYQELEVATDGATIGTALTALPVGPVPGAWDTINTLDVNIASGSVPVTTSDADVIAGSNAALVGQEVIQFATVTALGGTQYRLSRLLRGRRGSDGHAAEHVTGERFALLDTGVVKRITLGSTFLGTKVLVKAVTPGETIAGVTAQSVYVGGDELKEYAPYQLAGGRSAGNLTITFIARERKGAGLPSPLTIPADVEFPAYNIYVRSGSPKTISGISTASTASITSTAHSFSPGDKVFLTGIVGMYQANGIVATITGVTTNTFVISSSSLYWSPWISGGTAEKILRTIGVSAPLAVYSAANQTADGLTVGNPVSLAIMSVGANGDGYPLVGTI